MSSSEVSALIARLSTFAPAMQLEDVLSNIRRPEAAGAAEAKKRCALVRWFDENLYEFLCDGLTDKPSCKAFVASSGVEPLAPGKWVIEEGERSRLLAAWQSDQSVWRLWNKNIGTYFATKTGTEVQLAAVYHLAAAPSPQEVIPLFQKWFDQANERFDMAQCNALLEMLRLQESWRGPTVSQLWLASHQYYSARMLFVDDYYKTGSYFQRPEVFRKFLSVLDRTISDSPWIFHLHATGGIGKTIFLRWLIARYLVPNKVLCARVDFDDFRLDEMVNFPLRMFRRMVEQLSQQPQGGALSSLLEKLRREELTTGWNPDVMAEILRQLQGSSMDARIVVMLDTLEGATLSAANWLERCVNSLREIHAVWPRLTLVLSGRYDIAAHSNALLPGEFLNYELPRFSEAEAHQYLENRGIPAGPVRNAIVARAEADEDPDDQSGPPDNKLAGRNPFKLAMFAELALNRAKLTVEEVMRFPRADIAYLIERVIKRIESQPVRWIIRYGTIVRHLTAEFAQAVLLPPLLKALRGQNVDQPEKGLEDEDKDVWQPDTKAADELEKDGVACVWDKLSLYARDRGWLSSVMVDRRTELRFHPEVINPMRELLREQGIFNELEQRSAEFFAQKAGKAGSGSEEEVAASVRSLCEAVFHWFQVNGTAAEPYWIEKVRQAERFGAAFAVAVATEITGREYAEAERVPYPRVSSPEILIRAHCEAADLLMQAAGLEFASRKNWADFSRHMELALQIAGDNAYLVVMVPPFLRTVYKACASTEAGQLVRVLREAIPFAKAPRDRFFLELQLGQELITQASSKASIHLREALRILPNAERTSISAAEVYLELAHYYEFQGIHTAVIEAHKSATQSAREGVRDRAQVLNREAGYALEVGDIATAENRLEEMRKIPVEAHPSAAALDVLEARVALANLDPFAAIKAATRGLERAVIERDRARCLDLEGEARALLFEFHAALDRWESASSKYDLAGVPAGSARSALLAVALKVKVMGNYRDAETHIASASALRGSRDIEIQTELGLARAFISYRTGRRDEAAKIIAGLSAREETPPRIRARVLIFALVFALRKAGTDLLEDIQETVSQIQPMSLRDSVLDWVEHSNAQVDAPGDFVRRLVGCFARPSFESSRGTQLLIQRADLYRLFGMAKEAEAELSRAAGVRLLRAWRLNLAWQRLGLRTQFVPLLRRFQTSEFMGTPLYDALQTAAASEALRDKNVSVARELFGDRFQDPAEEVQSVWQARRLDVLVELSTSPERKVLKKQAAERYRALRQTSPTAAPDRYAAFEQTSPIAAPDRYVVMISDADLPASLNTAASSLEVTIDRLFSSWLSFADELREVLRALNVQTAPIEPVGRLAALPWELAGASWRQSSKVPSPAYKTESPMRPAAIRLVVPAHGEEEVGFESGSGSRLEDVYYNLGLKPEISYSAGPNTLFKDLQSTPPPVLLHMVAAVREDSGGICLDFASTAHRAESFNIDSGLKELSITAFRLDRMLASLPNAPFVVLDIGRPYNLTEAVRMLLLRNLFATQLFELGHVRGILACGLANSGERLAISSLGVEPLIHDTVTAPFERLRSGPTGDLEYILPRLAAALWTNRPDDRLFKP